LSEAVGAQEAALTMNDVAALTRVSIQTVFRAINRQPIVSPEIAYVVTPTLAARGSGEIPAP
jgi:hypothetical protein